MSELTVPERALLMPTRLEDEPIESENHFSSYRFPKPQNQSLIHSYLLRRIFSLFVLEAPSLPLTNFDEIHNFQARKAIPLRSLGCNIQKSLQGRKISLNPPNDCENRDPRETTVEERRQGFKTKITMKDSRKVAHNARKEALANLLEPLLGDGTETFVLLCWGKEHECSVALVSISDSADETVIWREIK